MRIVCLSSGGIDSTVMMHLLKEKGHDLIPLFIDYGQLAVDKEWESCQKVCNKLELDVNRLDVSGIGKLIPSGITDSKLDIERDAFLPNRNLMFLTMAAAYGFQRDAFVISIGLLSSHIFPDQTKEFIEKAKTAISESLNADIRIMLPLIDLDKYDVLRLGIKHNSPLDLAYFCHAGLDEPCGKCISCQEYFSAKEHLEKT